MNRRAFLAALGIGAPLAVVPRRVYSFLWDRPLVTYVGSGDLYYAENTITVATEGDLSALYFEVHYPDGTTHTGYFSKGDIMSFPLNESPVRIRMVANAQTSTRPGAGGKVGI